MQAEDSTPELNRLTKRLTGANQRMQSVINRLTPKIQPHGNKLTSDQAHLAESHKLEQQLKNITRKILGRQEDGIRKLSVGLEDEIVQTLEGIQIRLMILSKEISASGEYFKKDIAAMQNLVRHCTTALTSFIDYRTNLS